jgi:hypothetical protein
MIFPPEQIPRLPNHSGHPQNGESYQFGDPGQAIGTLKSITSDFGHPPSPWNTGPASCTFVGSEGVARATQQRMEILRFADAPYVLVTPRLLDRNPKLCTHEWLFLDPQYAPLFGTTDSVFGEAAERAHAEFTIPRLLEVFGGQTPLRFYGAPPCYVAITKDWVEVQQHGRLDRVSPKDIRASMEDGDVVLRATAFYEARFIVGETVNAKLLVAFLKIAGAA